MWTGGRSHEHGEQKHSRLELTVKVTTFHSWFCESESLKQPSRYLPRQSPSVADALVHVGSAAAVGDSFCACWLCPTWTLHGSYSVLSLKPRELALEVWGDSFPQERPLYKKRLESLEKFPPPTHAFFDGVILRCILQGYSKGLQQDWVLITEGNNQF